jgi:hypothetical protein
LLLEILKKKERAPEKKERVEKGRGFYFAANGAKTMNKV